jgi:predicted TIM-barrel fold metal-dependent hydrolase
MKAVVKMPHILDLRPFDSCVTLGTVVYTGCPRCLPTAEDVLEMMDRYHIAEALIHEHHARSTYPREHGNRRLLDAVKGEPRLYPVWVIEPPKQPGRDAAGGLVEEMLEAGVRVARLPMKVIPPLHWLWEDLCAVLEEHHIPCFLDFGDVSTKGTLTDNDVNGIRDIALAHPELPLILSHIMGGLGVHPGVVPLVRRLKNLYIDICGILEYWREVACNVGPERVLFASGAPFTDPGILISNVQYAHEVDERAKKMIYGDNLRRLMGQVR